MTEFLKGAFSAAIVILFLAFVLLIGPLAHCQNAVLMPLPEQPFSFNGAPLANGFVYTYFSGGFAPAPNFTDYTGLTQNTNPVVLNAGGYPTTSLGAQTGIWLQPGTLYRIVVQNASHVQIYQIDGVAGLVPSITNGTVSAVTATAPIASSGGTVPNISASVSGNGTNVATTNASSSTNNDIAQWDGSGNLKDSGTLLASLAPLASPTFTGTPVLPSNVIPASVLTGGVNGQCITRIGGVWQAGSCAGTAGVQTLKAATAAIIVNTNTTSPQTLGTYSFTSGALNTLGKSIRITSFIQINALNNSETITVYPSFINQAFTFTSAASSTQTQFVTMIETCSVSNTGAGGSLQCMVDFKYGNSGVGDNNATATTIIQNANPSGTVNLTGVVTISDQIAFSTGSTTNTASELPYIVELMN